MLYPLKFKPVYKDYIWGGRNLESLGKMLPEGIVAESWEVSCHKDGLSIISNGPLSGFSLPEYIDKYGAKAIGRLMGSNHIKRFPLLVKLIDANQDLSVQVHPDDDYARYLEKADYGKSEMWYIISAKPGAKVVYDVVPGISHEELEEIAYNGKIQDYLNYVDVYPGDTITVPAGVIHALGEGIVAAEIQQNSNITYRIYDYDRVDSTGQKRQLHIDKAFDVVRNTVKNPKNKEIILKDTDDYSKKLISVNEHFGVELYDIHNEVDENADGSRFYIYTFLEGEGSIYFKNGLVNIEAPESVFIPAAMGPYTIEGNLKAIKSYVPNVMQNFLFPLIQAGQSRVEVLNRISGLH